jgi:hypothetical protein
LHKERKTMTQKYLHLQTEIQTRHQQEKIIKTLARKQNKSLAKET